MKSYKPKNILVIISTALLTISGVRSSTPSKAEIAVSGDSRGRLIGTLSRDDGKTGIPGETVSVAGGSWSRSAVTGENGLFIVDIPLDARGRISLKAAGAETDVEVSDLPLRLTARPASARRSLEGEWQILTDPPGDWREATGWKPIAVPSNWEMKGFRAGSGKAVMRKTFDLPGSWKGRVIKLRADGIYSRCEAWLNGLRVGSHDGGATPVELDLTEAARPGEPNTIEVFIWGRSPASEIDRMSIYAYFEIAGIWRPIEVFSVAPVHVARTSWAVTYDGAFKDAVLDVDAVVANAGATARDGGPLRVRLLGPDGKEVAALTEPVSLAPWEEKTVPLRFRVTDPEPWTAEEPRLYKLEFGLGGETIESPVGFRQMEVRGNRFTINGRGAKLFGVCLHSAHPMDGRAISRPWSTGTWTSSRGPTSTPFGPRIIRRIPEPSRRPTGWGSTSRMKARPAGPGRTISAMPLSTWASSRRSSSGTETIPPWFTGRSATKANTPASCG